MSEEKIISVSIFDPTASIFKQKANTKAECDILCHNN